MSADSMSFQLNLKMTGFDRIISLKKSIWGSIWGGTNVDIEARGTGFDRIISNQFGVPFGVGQMWI